MGDSKKVLIVDDNEINGMLAAELIKAFALESEVVTSGEDAIERARAEKYAFILMDHVMPGMSGAEATTIIKKFSDVPIYAMTGDLTDEVRSEFDDAGAVGFIHKPLQPIEILNAVQANFADGDYSISADLQAMLAPKSDDGDSAESPLKRVVSTITGLDYESGMINSMNKEENYLRLLRAAAANIRQYTKILSEYLISADPESLKLASHSLKTVFANIGIEKLRMESEKMETRAHALIEEARERGAIPNFSEDHQNMIADYISDTMATALELDNALEEYEAEVSNGPVDYDEPEVPISDEDLKAVIQYTKDAFERYEIDYIFEGLEHLKKAMVHEKRKKIEEAIDATSGFMYDEAIRLFEEAISEDGAEVSETSEA